MEKITITFLGTTASIPTKERNHPSILLNYKDENILIDCGEGTQRQFRKANLNPCSITRILISHWHGDHILGLPGLFQTLALLGYNKTLHIYGPRNTKNFIELIMKMFVFVGKIKYRIIETSNENVIETSSFYIRSFQLKHGLPANGYSFIEKDKLRIDKKKIQKIELPSSPIIKKLTEGKDIVYKGRKIRSNSVTYLQKGRKISIAYDTGFFNELIDNVKNSNLLITESTYIEKDKDLADRKHHLTAKQAAVIAKKAKAGELILTHISQRYPSNEILNEARETFKNTKLARDFETMII